MEQRLTSFTPTQGQAGIVNSNDYIQRRSAYRMAKAIVMERRGGRCFDFPFYRARSKDLPPLAEPQLWQHFVKDGQFEGRPFRWVWPAVSRVCRTCTCRSSLPGTQECMPGKHIVSSCCSRASSCGRWPACRPASAAPCSSWFAGCQWLGFS